jgi:tetratricopeptide (TPR) repeat protein
VGPFYTPISKADYSEWRTQLRAALASDDLENLKELATADEAKEQQPTLITWLGRSPRQRGAVEQAVTVLRDAQLKHPGDLELNLELGQALLRTRDRKAEGLGYLRSAVALRPQSLVTLNALRNALDEHKQFDEWLELSRRIARVDTKNAWIHYGLGHAFSKRDMVDEAIRAYRKAIEIEPNNAAAHINLGNALLQQGEVDEAKEECQRVIALYHSLITDETRDTTWLTNRAMTYMALQQWEPAKVGWLRAIAIDPNQVQRAFKTYSQAEQWSDAVEYGFPYIDARPDNERSWMEVAPVLVLAGQRKDYAAFCERAAEQFADTTNLEVSERITKSLLPDAIEPDKLPTQPLIDSLKNGTATAGQSWFWTSRALLAYRTGDAKSAVQYATRSEEHKPFQVTRALALSVLAQHELVNTAEATTALQQATKLLEKLEQNTTRYDADLQIAKVLHREAEAKINGKTESTTKSATPKDKPTDPADK